MDTVIPFLIAASLPPVFVPGKALDIYKTPKKTKIPIITTEMAI